MINSNPKFKKYLQNMVGREEAEDLTQDVFLKVHKGLSKFDGRSKLSTWVYKIATNTALDRLRSSSFKHSLNNISEAMLDKGLPSCGEKNDLPVDEQLIENEMYDCIRRDIEKLPEKYRTIIILSELQDLRNQEIAEILGVSMEAVKTRLHRVRGLLNKELNNHCYLYQNSKDNLAGSPK